MTAHIIPAAEEDLEHAFNYYDSQRVGLGLEFITAFRDGLRRILENPTAWQRLDAAHRRYRLRRFPYGVTYWLDPQAPRIVVIDIADLRQGSRSWRSRRINR